MLPQWYDVIFTVYIYSRIYQLIIAEYFQFL